MTPLVLSSRPLPLLFIRTKNVKHGELYSQIYNRLEKNLRQPGADLGNFPGGGVIFHQTPKWYEKAREARENFFLPPPLRENFPPPGCEVRGGGSGGGKLFE